MRLCGKEINKRDSRKGFKSKKKAKDQLTTLLVKYPQRKRLKLVNKLDKKILARA